jgi:fructokinase
MSASLGLDIGGTKIAGAAFDEKGAEIAQIVLPTPSTYETLLESCRGIVKQLENKSGKADSIGVGACGFSDRATGFMKGVPNLPALLDKPFCIDLRRILNREIRLENDANCAALAESLEGAGKNYRAVFGLIMGTGIGGGFIFDGRVVAGANGMCGEIGHIPLPFYEKSDGEQILCACGQKSCIEQFIAGAGLARLYQTKTGKSADAKQIGILAKQGNADALNVLDHYYTLVAKAMVVVLHSFDPDIITVSGGLNALPALYDEVPKRWGKYALCKKVTTKFVPASFGAMAGLRGAALLGKNL